MKQAAALRQELERLVARMPSAPALRDDSAAWLYHLSSAELHELKAYREVYDAGTDTEADRRRAAELVRLGKGRQSGELPPLPCRPPLVVRTHSRRPVPMTLPPN